MDREIIVIDDDRGILEALCDFFELEGFRVICLDHPRMLQKVKPNSHPNVFLIDIMLPETTGIELAAQLRSRGFGDTPMIAMSASQVMVSAAQDTGLFQETISKPFDLNTVLDTVERYVVA